MQTCVSAVQVSGKTVHCRLVLQQYKQAEEAFERVIQLDEDCEDAKQELENVKIQQLVDMGFGEDQAFAAIHQYSTVQVQYCNPRWR